MLFKIVKFKNSVCLILGCIEMLFGEFIKIRILDINFRDLNLVEMSLRIYIFDMSFR